MEIVSRDLTRPFANIEGLISLTEGRLEKQKTEEVRDYLQKIAWICKQAVELVRDFVNQEFLESVQVSLLKKKISIIPKLELMIGEYQAAQHHIHKEFQLIKDCDTINVQLDDVKIMQSLNNLISNAIKFTHDEGIITVCVEDRDNFVLFSVADNGVGIPADLQTGLFEKFPRARREGLKGEPSTGLGLSITRRIVEWHDGRIWFESKENESSVFYIELPKQ